nr:putative reverse transcriptase domain-containing protein [Tanacetum cinerariifolium]
LRIQEEDIPITAFRTQYDHFEFQSKEYHEEYLKIILGLLKKEKVYAKFSKCDFCLDSMQLFDHLIDSKGVHVDPTKIKAIKIWTTPTTPTKVRQFLGLARYYQRFIEGFSLISKPLTKLTQKNKKYEWGEDEKEAFQMLKHKLCSAPILALLEGSKDFVVYCDASIKGFRAVLMQREKRQFVYVEILEDTTRGHGNPNGYEYRLPPTDGWSKREDVQTMEDMLRACVINLGSSSDRHLPLVEFSYNNKSEVDSNDERHVAPFEALYGRKCRLPVCMSKVGDSQLTGSEISRETTEKIVQIRNCLLTG